LPVNATAFVFPRRKYTKKSGPPGNMNAFKHGLAAIQKRREEGVNTAHEESVRQQILDGLIADKGGDEQISTATRILAEVIASDASWLMAFNNAIDHVIQNNPKARQNPRGLSHLDGYKRGLVNSLTGNLQKFGLDRVPRVKTLDELLQDDETSKNPTQNCGMLRRDRLILRGKSPEQPLSASFP
jgi:hypothetical protein